MPAHHMPAHRATMEARILAILADAPLGDSDLYEQLGISRSGAVLYTKRLRKAGKLHVCGHRLLPSGHMRPVYGLGNHPDATHARKRKAKRGDVKAKNTAAILAALPGESHAVAVRAKMSTNSALRYLLELRRAEPRQVRIASYRHPGKGGPWVPVYELGSAPDALAPGAESKAASKRRRGLHKRPVDGAATKQAVAQTIASAIRKPQGIFAALGV